MKKRKKITFAILILIFLFGITFVITNYSINKETKISNRIIKELRKTNKIVINRNNEVIGTIEEDPVILEILTIISEATGNMNGNFACIGAALYFEMYDGNKLIDEINIWISGNLMPKSTARGCAQYSLSHERKKNLNLIIEEQTGIKFFRIYGYLEECQEVPELIYNTEKFNYYLSCAKSNETFIEFLTTNRKMTVKEALEGNHISIEELIKNYPDLIYKETK